MRRSFSRGDGTGKGAGPASPLPPTRAPVEALSDKTAAESPADQATNLRLHRRWPPWCPPEREEPCPGDPCPPGRSPCPPWDPCPGAPVRRENRTDPDGAARMSTSLKPLCRGRSTTVYCPPGHLEDRTFPRTPRTPPLYA